MWIYVMGGAFGWRSLDKVNVGHRKDPLFGCVWDLPLIPILIHLPYHNHSLTLHTSDTPNNTQTRHLTANQERWNEQDPTAVPLTLT